MYKYTYIYVCVEDAMVCKKSTEGDRVQNEDTWRPALELIVTKADSSRHSSC